MKNILQVTLVCLGSLVISACSVSIVQDGKHVVGYPVNFFGSSFLVSPKPSKRGVEFWKKHKGCQNAENQCAGEVPSVSLGFQNKKGRRSSLRLGFSIPLGLLSPSK